MPIVSDNYGRNKCARPRARLARYPILKLEYLIDEKDKERANLGQHPKLDVCNLNTRKLPRLCRHLMRRGWYTIPVSKKRFRLISYLNYNWLVLYIQLITYEAHTVTSSGHRFL